MSLINTSVSKDGPLGLLHSANDLVAQGFAFSPPGPLRLCPRGMPSPHSHGLVEPWPWEQAAGDHLSLPPSMLSPSLLSDYAGKALDVSPPPMLKKASLCSRRVDFGVRQRESECQLCHLTMCNSRQPTLSPLSLILLTERRATHFTSSGSHIYVVSMYNQILMETLHVASELAGKTQS